MPLSRAALEIAGFCVDIREDTVLARQFCDGYAVGLVTISIFTPCQVCFCHATSVPGLTSTCRSLRDCQCRLARFPSHSNSTTFRSGRSSNVDPSAKPAENQHLRKLYNAFAAAAIPGRGGIKASSMLKCVYAHHDRSPGRPASQG